MNLEQIPQEGEPWLRRRHKMIGGTDIPSILGISPYKTALQLYEEKTSDELPPPLDNPAVHRGKRFEPLARAAFELIQGKSYPPALAVMDGYPHIGVSLDGWCKEDDALSEFKYTGKNWKFPEWYKAQCYYQLLVTGAEKCHYVGYDIIMEQVILHPVKTLYRDKVYQKQLFDAANNFWLNHVMKKIPPEPCGRDFVLLHELGLTEKLQRWKELQVKISELQTQSDEIEKYVKGLVTHKRMVCNDIRFFKIERKGAIDYGIVPELQGVDLEKYRKAGSEYVQMKVVK